MTLVTFVREFWKNEIERNQGTEVTLDGIAAAILKDAALTEQAVRYAVKIMRAKFAENGARQVLMGGGATCEVSLAEALVAHGLSLLDAKFGGKKLGDYVPVDLAVYAAQQRAQGQTMLVRASFLKAISAACSDPDILVREQLSDQAVEEIRARIVRVAPSAEVAERALVLQ